MDWTKIQRNFSIVGSISTIGTAAVKIFNAINSADINMTTNECFLWMIFFVFGTGLSIFFWLNARIDTLAKKVSQDYDNEHWTPAEQKQNVFFVLRNNDITTVKTELGNDLTTVNENLAKLEKRVKKLEPPQLTDEAIIRAYTN